MSGIVQIKAVAGNNMCADCGAADPQWASINLGILMCLECSGSHRSLGTHISKVRSLQLDVECWQGDLLDFFVSVGNAAFNKVWEAGVGSHVVRPQEFPLIPFVRQQYIMRKYMYKHFVSTCATGNCEHCDATSSSPVDTSSILHSGVVVKLGGKASTVFRRWQNRLLVLSSDRGLDYYKTETNGTSAPNPATSLGNVNLRGDGYSVYLLSEQSAEGQSGCFFGIDTPPDDPEHLGRKFLFKCADDAERVSWVEAIRSYMLTVDSPAPARIASEPIFSTSEATGASLISHLRHLSEEFCVSSALDIIHSGLLLHRPVRAGIAWEQRWCVLTSDALFITNADCKAAATEMGLGAVEVTKGIFATVEDSHEETDERGNNGGTPTALRPIAAHMIPLKVCYVDEMVAAAKDVPNDALPFGVWCPLDYCLLATCPEVNTDATTAKQKWIKMIKDAASEVRQVTMTTTTNS